MTCDFKREMVFFLICKVFSKILNLEKATFQKFELNFVVIIFNWLLISDFNIIIDWDYCRRDWLIFLHLLKFCTVTLLTFAKIMGLLQGHFDINKLNILFTEKSSKIVKNKFIGSKYNHELNELKWNNRVQIIQERTNSIR